MEEFKAKEYDYTVLRSNPSCQSLPKALMKDMEGKERMWCISPHHGRSYVVGKTDDGKYIVSKGNGLSYTQYLYLYSAEYEDNTWGLLLKRDAIRDFDMGMEIAESGIKTNVMEYVMELDTTISLPNGHQLSPILLQYTVECPYRICDAAYMSKREIIDYVYQWKKLDKWRCEKAYLIAANILINNLRILHSNGILHNAIHPQNYTWALELLDFELACSPSFPYDKEDDMNRVKDFFNREIIQTYEVINHIAWCLSEVPDYKEIDDIFYNYGFDLSAMINGINGDGSH